MSFMKWGSWGLGVSLASQGRNFEEPLTKSMAYRASPTMPYPGNPGRVFSSDNSLKSLQTDREGPG